jgi:hypothetical protein
MLLIDLLRERAVNAGKVRSDVETQDILDWIMGSCHAAGHTGSADVSLQRLVNILLAGIQPVGAR